MKNLFLLNGKNILITGASSGIGRQCAITASRLGANVILIARNEKRLKETYGQLGDGNHLTFVQDITKYEKLEEVVRQSVEKVGQISGFIHSAGIEVTLPLKDMEPSNYLDLFAVNVISGFEIAKILSKKKYLNNSGASFVFISSIMGVVGNAALVGYSSSKGALISGVKSMAVELSKKKIRVNCISPGYIQTPMMDEAQDNLTEEQVELLKEQFLLGLGTPEDVASAAVFLLSEASRWVTGTNLIIDGGYCAK